MRILSATEGSLYSEAATWMGTQIALRTGADLTLLTVASSLHPPKHETARCRQVLDQALSLASSSGTSANACVRTGEPAKAIVAEARTGEYNLVILGERPGRNIKKRILGTTVERVVATSPCPVLIARSLVLPHRLLICEGGRHPYLIRRLIAQLGPMLPICRQITVLHVMSQMAVTPNLSGWELQADAKTHMRRGTAEGNLLLEDVKALQEAPSLSQVKLRHGLVVDEVVTEARSEDYDLVVIGAHREEGWQRFLLDDLARQIILHTTQPLLIVT